eukprot:g6147.t1
MLRLAARAVTKRKLLSSAHRLPGQTRRPPHTILSVSCFHSPEAAAALVDRARQPNAVPGGQPGGIWLETGPVGPRGIQQVQSGYAAGQDTREELIAKSTPLFFFSKSTVSEDDLRSRLRLLVQLQHVEAWSTVSLSELSDFLPLCKNNVLQRLCASLDLRSNKRTKGQMTSNLLEQAKRLQSRSPGSQPLMTMEELVAKCMQLHICYQRRTPAELEVRLSTHERIQDQQAWAALSETQRASSLDIYTINELRRLCAMLDPPASAPPQANKLGWRIALSKSQLIASLAAQANTPVRLTGWDCTEQQASDMADDGQENDKVVLQPTGPDVTEKTCSDLDETATATLGTRFVGSDMPETAGEQGGDVKENSDLPKTSEDQQDVVKKGSDVTKAVGDEAVGRDVPETTISQAGVVQKGTDTPETTGDQSGPAVTASDITGKTTGPLGASEKRTGATWASDAGKTALPASPAAAKRRRKRDKWQKDPVIVQTTANLGVVVPAGPAAGETAFGRTVEEEKGEGEEGVETANSRDKTVDWREEAVEMEKEEGEMERFQRRSVAGDTEGKEEERDTVVEGKHSSHEEQGILRQGQEEKGKEEGEDAEILSNKQRAKEEEEQEVETLMLTEEQQRWVQNIRKEFAEKEPGRAFLAFRPSAEMERDVLKLWQRLQSGGFHMLDAHEVKVVDYVFAHQVIPRVAIHFSSCAPAYVLEMWRAFVGGLPVHVFLSQPSIVHFTPVCCTISREFVGYAAESLSQVQQLSQLSDLTLPHNWYPRARAMKRKIFIHAGPTNSGKTHKAIKRLLSAQSGCYCAPLRLLAWEVQQTLTLEGLACNLYTGQEKVEVAGARHSAHTVEMASLETPVEVAVIDEVQMLSSRDRGHAWTRAFLGIPAQEIHVCGEVRAVNLVRRLADITQDEVVEAEEYRRLSPLELEDRAVCSLSNIRKGDCIVSFRRNELYQLKNALEKQTGLKAALVYGALPPAVRKAQASLFNQSNSPYDVLIASDAVGMGLNLNIRRIVGMGLNLNIRRIVGMGLNLNIRRIVGMGLNLNIRRIVGMGLNLNIRRIVGMGLNLNIRRIVFHTLDKFDGLQQRLLTPWEMKQIAGRAGRFNSNYPKGFVTTFYQEDLATLTQLWEASLDEHVSEHAGLSPSPNLICSFMEACPDVPLSTILLHLEKNAQIDRDLYFMNSPADMISIADLIEDIRLENKDRLTFCSTPVNNRKDAVMGALYRFCSIFARGKVVTINHLGEGPLSQLGKIMQMVETGEVQADAFNSRLLAKQMSELEKLYESIDCYCWLAGRFGPARFPDGPLGAKLRTLVATHIEERMMHQASQTFPSRKKKAAGKQQKHQHKLTKRQLQLASQSH